MSSRVTRRWGDRPYSAASLDREFDRLVPSEIRHLSATHWTPVQVAVRATSLLCATRSTRVLDVGSGVGKLCSIGALSTLGTWVGVEHQASLVDTATQLARAFGVAHRTTFVTADAFTIDWSGFDALYFYNPFESSLFDVANPDASTSTQIARVHERLAALPSCTRVVTLHGFGGAMPASFELLYHERMPYFGLDLALWIQRSGRRATRAA